MEFPLDSHQWCGPDSSLLDVAWEPEFKVSDVDTSCSSLWRYRTALPLSTDADIVSFGEGLTPLLNIQTAASE